MRRDGEFEHAVFHGQTFQRRLDVRDALRALQWARHDELHLRWCCRLIPHPRHESVFDAVIVGLIAQSRTFGWLMLSKE